MTNTTSNEGARNARAQILESARELFAQKGFRATTLRAVAQHAHVDVALVPYYFKNKDGLFDKALELTADPRQSVREALGQAPDRDGALAQILVTLIDEPCYNRSLLALLQSVVDHDQGAEILASHLDRFLLEGFRDYLPASRLRREVGLLAADVVGIVMLRHLVKLDPLAAMSRDELAEHLQARCHEFLEANLPVAQTRS